MSDAEKLLDEMAMALMNCRSLVQLKFGNTDPTANAAVEEAGSALSRYRNFKDTRRDG